MSQLSFKPKDKAWYQHDWSTHKITGKEHAKHYWKLDPATRSTKNDLKDRGYLAGPAHISSARVQYLHSRLQRCMLNYDACSLVELRKFCADRGIRPHHRGNKAEVVKALEVADEAATFPILELPPELRVAVYDFYLVGLRAEMKRGSSMRLPEPPLAEVSCLVRKEFIPLFYDRLWLRIYVDYPDIGHGTLAPLALGRFQRLRRLRHFRNLAIVLRIHPNQRDATFDISFKNDRKTFSITRYTDEVPCSVLVALLNVIEEDLNQLLQSKTAGINRAEWEIDDPQKILSCFN